MLSRFRFTATLLAWLALMVAGLRGQYVSTANFAGPDGLVTDAEFGIAFTRPTGWDLAPMAPRFGDQNGNIFLTSKAAPTARLGLAYQGYYDSFAPAEGLAAWLEADAGRRVKSPGPDVAAYTLRPGSMKPLTIDGHPALSWSADFMLGKESWRESHIQIVSAETRVLFFMRLPTDQAEAFAPEFERMAASLHLTAGTWRQELDPRIFEARKQYKAQEYAQARATFTAAFLAKPPRASDLIVAAGAAAHSGQPDLALDWLKQAVAKDANQARNLERRPEFSSLRETDGWKQLVANLPRGSGPMAAPSDPALQKELLAIHEEDQKYRRDFRETEKKFGLNSPEYRALMKAQSEADDRLLVKVMKILDERGWVGPDVVGTQGNSALFLVIQHADLEIQKKYIPMMREAVKKGAAQASSLALMEDRVALRSGRPQIYGSQIGRDPETGAYLVDYLEDPEHVDERRASVGLEPLAAYTKRFDFTWDLAAYKQQQAKREQAKAAK